MFLRSYCNLPVGLRLQKFKEKGIFLPYKKRIPISFCSPFSSVSPISFW